MTVVTQLGFQDALKPVAPPCQYRWYDWGESMRKRGLQAKWKTPEMVKCMEAVVQVAVEKYRDATGREPTLLVLQTPAQLFGRFVLNSDGTFGELCGLQVVMDTGLSLCTFGLSDEMCYECPLPRDLGGERLEAV
jgi:hypothetical protein